jgi:transcriptional regulator with XRE-family HTH domain
VHGTVLPHFRRLFPTRSPGSCRMKAGIDTFGTRFGALVRRKRAAKGWSQERLAVEAFNDEMRSSRIGEWENGRVARPQAPTIAALARALDLTPQEIDACDPQKASAQAFKERLEALERNLVARIEALSGVGAPVCGADGTDKDTDAPTLLVKYCNAASRAWDRLDLIGDWPRQPGRSLKLLDLYIAPALRMAPARSLGSEGVNWESPAVNVSLAPRNEHQVAAIDRAQQRSALGLLVPEFDRIALFGRAGIGKSCLLRTLALGYAARWRKDQRIWRAIATLHDLPDRMFLPLLIDTKKIGAFKAESGWDALVAEAVRQLASELAESAEAVRHAIHSFILAGGETLLLVDGLDEGEDLAARRLVDLIDTAQQAHPAISVILASRWSRGRLIRSRIPAEEVEVLDLDAEGRRLLLGRLYARAGADDPDAFTKSLLETLGGSPILLQASRTPLFLELLAANLAGPKPRLPPADETLARALLTVLFDRRPTPATLLDLIGWERPAAHVALSMLAPDIDTIDRPHLYAELRRAFDHLGPSVPIAHRSDPEQYSNAMIDSGLLRAEPLAWGLARDTRYDFAFEAIKEWLAVTALFENWSPDGFGSNSDGDQIVRALLGALDRPIPFSSRDRLRLALLTMPEKAATRLLDRIIAVPDADQNLTFTFQVMQAGRAPGRAAAWEAIQRCCAILMPTGEPEVRTEIFALLCEDFGGPEEHPVPWGTILGLYAGNLPGAARALHTSIDRRGWLLEPLLVDTILSRIGGGDPLDSCAAMFEVLDWAFSVPLYVPNDAERAMIERIAAAVMLHVPRDDSRADFAIWTLNWLCMANTGTTAWIDVTTIDQEAMTIALANRRLSDLARRAAGAILSKPLRQTVDPQLRWLDCVSEGRFGEGRIEAEGYSIFPGAADAVRAAMTRSNDPYSRGVLALVAAELGAHDPTTLEVATDFAISREEYVLQDRAVVALATGGTSSALRHLTRLLTSTIERIRVSAAMALLATADLDAIRSLRAAPEARLWAEDIRTLIDDAIT